MEKRKVKRSAVFYPGTMGVFILLIIILSFTAGAIRRELVLTLTGAVILAIWTYCLVMTLLLALLHRRRAKNISIRLEPEKIACEGWTNAAFRYSGVGAAGSGGSGVGSSGAVGVSGVVGSGSGSSGVGVSSSVGGSVSGGGNGGKNIFQLPGILVRCRVLLSTKDGRRVAYDFKPEDKNGLQQNMFQVKKRGAYFSAYDEFAIFDILGFFRFAYRVPVNDASGDSGGGNDSGSSGGVSGGAAHGDSGGASGAITLGSASGARLLVSPGGIAEPLPVKAKGGDANRQDALSLERTDYLIDHRPYVPGDDPRRINWKLYGHAGELIVRQGEREPPPSSSLTILIDTRYDSLYSVNSAPDAVDLLCENALAIINNAGKEISIQVGFTGRSEKSRGATSSGAAISHHSKQRRGNQRFINSGGAWVLSCVPGGYTDYSVRREIA